MQTAVKHRIVVPRHLPTLIANKRETRNKYMTNRLFKCLETLLFLKTQSPSGKLSTVNFKSYHSFVAHLADVCQLAVNTMYDRLDMMKTEGFITVSGSGSIYLVGWEKLFESLNSRRKDESYTIELKEGMPKLEHILKVLAISENKAYQRYRFEKQVRHNPQVSGLVKRLFPEMDGEKLRQMIVRAQVDSFISGGSENYDAYHTLRADDNASIEGLGKRFGYNNLRAFSYIKQLLKRLGLIQAERRVLESDKVTRLPHNVFNGEMVRNHNGFNQETGKRWLMLPDLIRFSCPGCF